MKKTVQDYISTARQNSGVSMDRKVNFVGQPSMYANATGAAQAASGKRSMPYAITVSSASAAAVAGFDVLGAFQYINNAGFTAGGDLVIGSITITSAIPGISYRELLYQSMNNPFTVGQTYISCSNTLQVNEVFSIVTKDANGTIVTIPIVPTIDPYQNLNTVNVVDTEYRIDGFTKLTWASIQPNAVLTVRFFPLDNVNPARALNGKGATQSYQQPNIIRG